MQRRAFVSSLTLAAGAAGLGCVGGAGGYTASAQRASRRRTAPDASPMPRHPTVPESDTAIRSIYPPIPPFETEVFEQRLERARELMRSAGATILLATSGATNFEYLVGENFGRSERLIALLLPLDEAPTVIAPAFEVERVHRGARVGAVRGWEEAEDPFALVRDTLGGAGAAPTIAVEPKTEYWTAMAIARALPRARLLDGTPIFEELRLRKTAGELLRMRRAIDITQDVIAATFARLAPGMRDADVQEIFVQEHADRGVQGGALVQFGPQSALPHGGVVNAELRAETVVLIDGGGSFQGYASDITRTRWFGSDPPAKFRELYNTVYDAQTAAMERVRPGVPAQEIDRAARRVIEAAGYGKYFTHRLGHGMGMEGHEPAYIVEGNTRPLEPGFVFSVEPGIYLPGEFGVRLEDDYTCTADGGELLSRRPPRV